MKTEDFIAGKNGKVLQFQKNILILNKFDWKKSKKYRSEVLICSNIWENFPIFMHLKFLSSNETKNSFDFNAYQDPDPAY